MRTWELRIDVTGVVDLPGTLFTAVSVHLPDRCSGPTPVLFGFPGGGYSRRYFDIRLRPGYSQAAYHVDRGCIFVACDHLYVGDSSHPDRFALTFEDLAIANHATTQAVRRALSEGSPTEGVDPIEVAYCVGMGQSMGGCLLTVQQARHRSFDAVAFLGWSGIFTNFPLPDGGRLVGPRPARGTDIRSVANPDRLRPDAEQFRYCFHWPDELDVLKEADLATCVPERRAERGGPATPWGSPTIPACSITMTAEGVVALEAAAIDVPVLSASGERDVVPDPWAEPAAYRSSPLVTTAVVARMAHMHNFAPTRGVLWDHISWFAQAADPRAQQRPSPVSVRTTSPA